MRSDNPNQPKELLQQLIGLGEKSLRKSYYPELRIRLNELERFRALLDQSNDIIILMDASTTEVVDANQTAARLLGQIDAQLSNLKMSELIDLNLPFSFEQLRDEARKSAAPIFEGICYFNRQENPRTPIEFTAKLVEFATREYLMFVGRDISQRRQEEEEKRLLQTQLAQAQKMEALGTLAGGIVHDFNNILSGILGYSELALASVRQGQASPRELEQIIKFTTQAQDLIKQILAFSRKNEPQLSPLNLNKVIHDVISLVERSIPRMISLKLHLAPGLRLVNGDANQIDQVLLNLATNAKDAMPGGGKLILQTENVTLEEEYASTHLELAPGDYVRLTVTDTGQGMDRDTLAHIFEPFFTTKSLGEGTGLGLASVFGIIKGHGGHIICYSQPGQGTSFKIYLPTLPSGETMGPEQKREVESFPRGSETILLVDDEQFLLEIATRFLETQGYRVLTARHGEEALHLYQEQSATIDLVVLDLNMPGMGGSQCLREIRQIRPDAAVVIASGYLRDLAVRDISTAGAAGYLEKPYKRSTLLRTIREVLDGEKNRV
ncbi:MAG: response regulator [Deltaproteobacteria bacterium]|nr:response regulator [Deltaproteobacteria bacterium]